MSNKIIMPPSAPVTVDPMNVLGHIRVGNSYLNVSLMSEVNLDKDGSVQVVMASGNTQAFKGQDAQDFQTQINEVAAAILQRMSPSAITQVPPGTRLVQ